MLRGSRGVVADDDLEIEHLDIEPIRVAGGESGKAQRAPYAVPIETATSVPLADLWAPPPDDSTSSLGFEGLDAVADELLSQPAGPSLSTMAEASSEPVLPGAFTPEEDEDVTTITSALPSRALSSGGSELITLDIPRLAEEGDDPTPHPYVEPERVPPPRVSTSMVTRAVAAAEAKRLTVAPRVETGTARPRWHGVAAVFVAVSGLSLLAWILLSS